MSRNVIAKRLVDIADELDSLGLVEEANEVDSIVKAMAGGGMMRAAQSNYWENRLPREFAEPVDKATNVGMGSAKSGWGSVGSAFGGGGERFNLWKSNVWDKMSPDQQEQFRESKKMASWAKPLNQELFDYWAANVQPKMSEEYYGQKSPISGSQEGSNVGGITGASSLNYNDLDRQIDAARKELIRLQQAKQQMLQGTKGYSGGEEYSQMMKPVQQQHL